MSEDQSQPITIERKFKMSNLPWTTPPRPELVSIQDVSPEVVRGSLTFGVEFEFFVMGDAQVWQVDFERDIFVFERHVRREFMRSIRNAGITIADQMDLASLPAAAIRNYFYIESDDSISGVDEQGILEIAVGLEISSPPLPFNDESFALIERVSDLIRINGGQVNETCGLHVHVGTSNLLAPGFSLKTAKLVAHLTTIAYEQFNQLHDQSRVLSTFATSPHLRFESEDVYEIANAIEDIQTMDELIEVFHLTATEARFSEDNRKLHKYMAVNYTNLKDGGIKTIEFRAHAGTLDPYCVKRWIQTVGVIVERSCALQNPFIEITRKIKAARDGSGGKYTIHDLFTDLNAAHLVEEWTKDELYWHRHFDREEYPDLDFNY